MKTVDKNGNQPEISETEDLCHYCEVELEHGHNCNIRLDVCDKCHEDQLSMIADNCEED